jgi:DNA polymerase III subunit delta'
MADVFPIDHDDLPMESDRFGEHPHPRETLWYAGSNAPERLFIDAWQANKMHHAWLITGPEGIGKATLAYRMARFLLAHPEPDMQRSSIFVPTSLEVGAENPVTGKLARLSHQDVTVILRMLNKEGKAFKTEIAIDDIRSGLDLFRVTAGAGGWRIVIVDCMDDLNAAGMNALLKMLEEPPQRAIFLLIAHQPGRLLPTIRSRCRVLKIAPLPQDKVVETLVRIAGIAPDAAREAAQHADGSVRAALQWLDPALEGFRRDAARLLADPARADSKAVQQLVAKTTGKAGEGAFEALLAMIEQSLRQGLPRPGLHSPPQNGLKQTSLASELAARAELWEKLRRSARDVEAYNLDRRPFLLSVFSDLAALGRRA